MITILENILLNKTKDTPSEILYAHWNYDKRIIPTALNSISNIFPHYSLHDESHSISIINNIIRIIGVEKINELSAIDIWLVLESTYLHDIGMVISGEKIYNLINSDDFVSFIKSLQNDNSSSLMQTANLFQIVDNKIKYKDDIFSFDIYEGIKYLLASYFRQSHAEHSKDIINNPIDEIHLKSPRGVIPKRLFNILADICSCHTKDFSEVLKLPKCEVGIDVEDAHPRYVACLLRLGDLLDLDNNRFSDVLLSTLKNIPVETLIHKEKDLSIENLRIDNQQIEIKAKCESYEVADLLNHWFDFINSEIRNQMIKWNEIVPNSILGNLPTVGNLEVELFDYELIDGKKRPQFSINSEKGLNLLKGAGLYNGAYQSIREILQNSIDATLIRFWLENKELNIFQSPQNEDFIKYTKSYPIIININSIGIKNGYQRWIIKIKDNGTGISISELNFLMSTGSSSNNIERHKIINKMPIWLRPSGAFGIGFQSIFMLTDEVKIITKSFFNEQLIELRLNDPDSAKKGAILIKKINSTHSIKPGSELILEYKTKAIPSNYSINLSHQNAWNIAKEYDPFTMESLDIELGKLIDEISNISEQSYFPIELFFEDRLITKTNNNKSYFKYFDEINYIGIDFEIEKEIHADEYFIFLYFKNQRIETNELGSLYFLHIKANINKYDASEILLLNRNDIIKDKKYIIKNEIIESSLRLIIKNFYDIFLTDIEKIYGSMFLHYYSKKDSSDFIKINQFNQWEELSFKVDDHDIIIKNIFEEFNTISILFKTIGKHGLEKLHKDDNTLEITTYMHVISKQTMFLLHKANDLFSNIQLFFNSGGEVEKVIISKEKPKVSISDEELSKYLIHHYGLESYSARIIMPCSDSYPELRLKDSAFIPYINTFNISYNINLKYPKMLSPFINMTEKSRKDVKININDKLLDWVYINRYYDHTSKADIKKGYDGFINFFSTILQIN